MEPISAAASIVALGHAARLASRCSQIFYEIASKAGTERICDDIELFASHISLFSSALKSSHALIRDHYDKYQDSSTLERLERDDILRKLSKQSDLLSKRLKALRPTLKEENVGLGFWGRFEWVVVKVSTREHVCVWMERVKTNFLLIQYEVMYEALKKRFEDPKKVPNKSLFNDMQSELKDVQKQIKLHNKSIRVMSVKYDALTSGPPYEAHNDELDEIENFVSEIGESMVSETISPISTSSSRRSTRSRQPSSPSNNSSQSSRPSSSHKASRQDTIPSPPSISHQNSRHEHTSHSQDALEDPELRSPMSLPPEQSPSTGLHHSHMPVPAEPSRHEDQRQAIQLSPARLPGDDDNLPSGSTPPASEEKNKSELSVISSSAVGRTQDEGQPGWADGDYIEVRNSDKLLFLNPTFNSKTRVTSVFCLEGNSVTVPTTATLNRAFPANLISSQLAQKLGASIEYFPDDDTITEVQIGSDGQWKEVVVGIVRFIWTACEEPDLEIPCVALVCDYADCERVPFPLIFGKSFVLERRRLRNERNTSM